MTWHEEQKGRASVNCIPAAAANTSAAPSAVPAASIFRGLLFAIVSSLDSGTVSLPKNNRVFRPNCDSNHKQEIFCKNFLLEERIPQKADLNADAAPTGKERRLRRGGRAGLNARHGESDGSVISVDIPFTESPALKL